MGTLGFFNWHLKCVGRHQISEKNNHKIAKQLEKLKVEQRKCSSFSWYSNINNVEEIS